MHSLSPSWARPAGRPYRPSVVFQDGFESGDPSAWARTVAVSRHQRFSWSGYPPTVAEVLI